MDETGRQDKQMQSIKDKNIILHQYYEEEIKSGEDLERRLAMAQKENDHIESILHEKNTTFTQLQVNYLN